MERALTRTGLLVCLYSCELWLEIWTGFSILFQPVQVTVFLDVTPCCWMDKHQCFGGICQPNKSPESLKMGAAVCSKTLLLLYQSAQCDIP
jgi:hypothetical protein